MQAGHVMPPAPSGVFTGSKVHTMVKLLPGLGSIPKGDVNAIPPFTAPKPPAPSATAGAFFPAGPDNSTTTASKDSAAISTTLTAIDAAATETVVAESSTTTVADAVAPSATESPAAPSPTLDTAADPAATPPPVDNAALPPAEANAGDAAAPPADATAPDVTPAAIVETPQETEVTIDVSSLTMANSGMLGITEEKRNVVRRARRGKRMAWVVPAGGYGDEDASS